MNDLTIHYPTEEIKLLPIARTQLKQLKSLLIELQSYWLEYVFSVGDLMADDHCWQLMGDIANLLPRATNAAVRGFDLEALSNDYEQIEALFLCQGKNVDVEQVHNYRHALFNLDEFSGCKILALHRFNPRSVLEEAEALQRDRGPWVSPAKAALALNVSRDRLMDEVRRAEEYRLAETPSDVVYDVHYRLDANEAWEVNIIEFEPILKVPESKPVRTKAAA